MMHKLASRNRPCKHIGWILLRINFLDCNPLLNADEVVSYVNMFTPFIMDLIIG